MDQLELSESVAQHALKVLRMREGERLRLFNGQGLEFLAELLPASRRSAQARLLESIPQHSESSLRIELGQALSRGERMDFAIQKATELGCAQITPLFTERCEVRLDAQRQDKRQRHWQQIAISACEQSQRQVIPEIAHPVPLQDWLSDCQADLKLVLDPHQALSLGEHPRPQSIALLIGPEGGLSAEEIELARNQGFLPLTLGPRVLRTETAPVAACAILQYLWGDLS